MGEAAIVLNLFDPEKERQRNQSLVAMKVKVRNCANWNTVHGNIRGPGEHVIHVYAGEVKTVLEQVETEHARMVAAQDAFMASITKEVAEIVRRPISLEELRKLIEAKADKDINEAYEKALSETSNSPEREFQDLVGRSLHPLESAVVIEEGIPEPQRVGLKNEQDKLSGALASALETAITNALGRYAETQKATIEQTIKEMLGEKKGGK